MSGPLEMIASPFDVYFAPATEPEPAPSVTPAGNWLLMGSRGKNNQADGGVSVQHKQTIKEFTTEGNTGVDLANRQNESLLISFALSDLTPALYTQLITAGAPTTVAPSGTTPGYQHIPLYRGITVAEFSLLVRGPSPLFVTGNSQWYIPRCYEGGSPTIKLTKAGLATVSFEFHALIDQNAVSPSRKFGRFSANNTV